MGQEAPMDGAGMDAQMPGEEFPQSATPDDVEGTLAPEEGGSGIAQEIDKAVKEKTPEEQMQILSYINSVGRDKQEGDAAAAEEMPADPALAGGAPEQMPMQESFVFSKGQIREMAKNLKNK